MRGNKQVKRMLQLIQAQSDVGNFWAFEQPKSSYMLRVPEVLQLLEQPQVSKVLFDQCAFGLRPPDYDPHEGTDKRVKKPTALVTNLPHTECLARKCDGKHVHVHAIGSCKGSSGKHVKRSRVAGTYPPALCRLYSRSVLKALQGH